MDNNRSYARRSRRYRDRSNFGAEEEYGPYECGESGTGKYEGYGEPGQDEYGEPVFDDYDRPDGYDSGFYSPEEEYLQPEAQAYAHGGQGDGPIPESYPPDDLLEYDEFGRRRDRHKEKKAHNRAREAWGWVISIALAVAAAFVIRAFVFEIILVDGESMYPTLYTNERVAVEKISRYGGLPERGDIIIVEYPGMTGTYVKRAVGLPGETVEVRDSTVYINGQPLAEPYVNPEPYADMQPVVVPPDHVFVMGDNRAHSLDSRTSYIGPIPHDAIIGHGLSVIWPLTNIHSIN